MKAFGVGRPALREAMRILESESLLQVRRGVRGGAYVTLPTRAVPAQAAGRLLQYWRATVRDVFDTRSILEAAGAARIAYHGSAEDHAHLRSIWESWHSVGFDLEAWNEHSVAFHSALTEESGLNSLALLGGIIQEITERIAVLGLHEISPLQNTGMMQRGINKPRDLVKLIEARLGAEAETFWMDYRTDQANWWFSRRSNQTVLDLFDEPTDEKASGKLADTLADALRRKIVSGELQQDDLLPQESKLAEELGVGLPGLREALRILESESLIIVERGAQGGARIQAPTAEAAARPASVLLQIQDTTLEDVYDTQDILEAASARRLAAEGTRRDHRKLRVAFDELASMDWEPDGWLELHWKFHTILVELAGLKSLQFLSSILDEITTRHKEDQAGVPWRDGSRITSDMTLRSQRRLVEQIEDRDASGAEEHWRSHLSGLQHRILQGR